MPLRTESEGKQDYLWETQRTWKIVDERSLNRVGTPVAYKLVPGAALPHTLPEDSPVLRTAEALRHTLWVTPYAADERWPCGRFPNQAARDGGLPGWTAADRPIEDAEIVLWYVFGHPPHHAHGGLADHAGRRRLVLAEAVRLLRPQPRARPAADAGALRSQVGRAAPEYRASSRMRFG